MMIFFFNGVAESHTAVLLPRLQEPDSPIHINPDQMTWIGQFSQVFQKFPTLIFVVFKGDTFPHFYYYLFTISRVVSNTVHLSSYKNAKSNV